MKSPIGGIFGFRASLVVMKIRATTSRFCTAALAGVLHFPLPCLPMDALCRFEQAAHLHTHQYGPTLPLIDSKQTIIRTATGELTAK